MERYITRPLKGHDSAQALVRIYESGKLELISYRTLVARAIPEECSRIKYVVEPLGQFWDGQRIYSNTTARHIRLFLYEFFDDVSYKEFKLSAMNSVRFGKAEGTLRREVNLNYEW